MAAGISVPHDRCGFETADLIHNAWPRRPGEPLPREFNVSSCHIGVGVESNAQRRFVPASFDVPRAAGESTRIHAYYKKTGTLQHRCEAGFRNTRAPSTLTEVPGMFGDNYGTMRKSLQQSQPLTATKTDNFSWSAEPMKTPPGTVRRVPSRSVGGSSRGSGNSGSRTPSWARASQQSAAAQPWNFEPLAAFSRTNETYGSMAGHTDPRRLRCAGKSDTGFLDPQDLIKTLTRYD
jgi:hypothetical protein